MAVVTVKSTAITNVDATPIVQNTPLRHRGTRKHCVGTVAVANGNSIASQFRMCRVRSAARVVSLSIYCDAITSAAATLGLYDVNGGAVVRAARRHGISAPANETVYALMRLLDGAPKLKP